MKKINNKGMTLIELLVSVALISIIMLFMYKLISDVRAEKKDNDKLTDNILKINEIEVESVNEIISKLIYEKEEINTVRLWNDIWYNSNNSVTSHNIRFDIIKNDGTMHEYSIAIDDVSRSTKHFEIHIKEKSSTVKKWSLSEEVKDIEIEENCNFNANQLVCQIDLNLLDSNAEHIYTISYPLYFYTTNFKTDNGKTRNCTSGNSCFNCPGYNYSISSGNNYDYTKLYNQKLIITSKSNQCSL